MELFAFVGRRIRTAVACQKSENFIPIRKKRDGMNLTETVIIGNSKIEDFFHVIY